MPLPKKQKTHIQLLPLILVDVHNVYLVLPNETAQTNAQLPMDSNVCTYIQMVNEKDSETYTTKNKSIHTEISKRKEKKPKTKSVCVCGYISKSIHV